VGFVSDKTHADVAPPLYASQAVVYELCSMREQRGFCPLWSKSFALVYGFS
jgi:hypothetical protein